MQSSQILSNQHTSLNLKGSLVSLHQPLIMGILNVTPDSFFDGGQYMQPQEVLERATQILEQGADIIDIGAYSSRPDAQDISEEEETKRLIPAIELIIQHFPHAYISVDTFRANVAQRAIESGACMINDISGGNLDSKMFETVIKLKVPYILMHMKGSPQTMKKLNQYEDLVLDILDYFQQKVYQLRQLGQTDIILDVGFGFAKNISQNFLLLQQQKYFQALNLPLLIGISRKSMIYKTLNIQASEALNGTSILNTVALLENAHILRVHDVKEANEVRKLMSKLKNENSEI